MAADIGRKVFRIEDLMKILPESDDRAKVGRTANRLATLPVFIEAISHTDKELSDDELRAFGWFEYQCSLSSRKTGASRETRVLAIMRDTVKLFNDIKDYGLKSPLDMWWDGTKYILIRGWRRIIIMDVLHRKGVRRFSRIPVRVFKNRASFDRHQPSPVWSEGKSDGNTIHNLAVKQFAELGRRATDKYWIHNYTPYYDLYCGHLRTKRIKILEFGVERGASLALWSQAFPRAMCYGVDLDESRWKQFTRGNKRIKVLVGNQANKTFLAKAVIPEGPYDIIVDDASHKPEDQLISFTCMWPHLRRGGIYVIEDLHTNYRKRFAPKGPLMIDAISKCLHRVINTDNKSGIRAIHAYYDIVFIEK